MWVQGKVGPLFKARSRHSIVRLYSGHLRKSGSATYEDSIKALLRHCIEALLRTLGEELVLWDYCFLIES